MSSFAFCDRIPASKSLLNRFEIIRLYQPQLRLLGHSMAEDVIAQRRAIRQFRAGESIDCGAAGTVFRFMALAAFRQPGVHFLTGTPRLLERPQSEILQLAQQMNVSAKWVTPESSSIPGLIIDSRNFQIPRGPVEVDHSRSSQFVSALLLNGWNLAQPLKVVWRGDVVSRDYFLMTLKIVRSLGMNVETSDDGFQISPHQIPCPQTIPIECDMSSAFAIAALAAVAGRAEILDFPTQSLQPDFRFVEILKEMGVSIDQERGSLRIEKSPALRPLKCDLNSSPDLFPVLAVLCAAADGESHLLGAPQLKHKESDRIQTVESLLKKLGVETRRLPDGLIIFGRGPLSALDELVGSEPFYCDHDHRLVMAGAVAQWAGASGLLLSGIYEVKKSFPEFLSLSGLLRDPLVLVGHRGAGKTALLNRLQESGWPTEDLDALIERKEGRPIESIFSEDGEHHFRKLENQYFLEWLEKQNSQHDTQGRPVMALGAGFCGEIPKEVETVWVRRKTDRAGRIFLNRPRLNPDLWPLKEWEARFSGREERYCKLSDWVFELEEGFSNINRFETSIFCGQVPQDFGFVTVQPHFLKSETDERWLKKLPKGFGLELRDDLLSEDQLHRVLDQAAGFRILLSFRNPQRAPSTFRLRDCAHLLDLPLAQGFAGSFSANTGNRASEDLWEEMASQASRENRQVVRSCHDRPPEKFSAFLSSLRAPQGQSMKLALSVTHFSELQTAHQWWCEDPTHRTFLPMSKEGRWAWYRQLFGRAMPLAFVRLDEGSSADQPSLFEWLRGKGTPSTLKEIPKNFAAILGDPVDHSQTPAEQFDFFEQLEMPVVRISMPLEEWSEDTLLFLQRLGLRAAAVTSPLKEKTAKLLKTGNLSVNTLSWSKDHWRSANTDVDGLKAIETKINSILGDQRPSSAVAVWGGGGVLSSLRLKFPEARYFSARTGELREDAQDHLAPLYLPEVVIWAVGRNTFEKGLQFPPPHWTPKAVFDLNYSENSPGLEYAALVPCEYVSGLAMFREQAARQREFWSEDVSQSNW